MKTVFPQAVSLHTKVIPDIYKVSEIKEGYIKLETDLKKGDKVKLIFEKDEQTSDELVEVLSTDRNGFTVNNKNEGKVFVFGKQVDDFHVVDYDAVSMLNVSATQELYKLILKQQKTIDTQKKQISAQIEESKKTQSNFDERIKNRILNSGAIGRRYRRLDEIGAPFAITVDHQTKEDNTVTIRRRDDMAQNRVNISELESILAKETAYP